LKHITQTNAMFEPVQIPLAVIIIEKQKLKEKHEEKAGFN